MNLLDDLAQLAKSIMDMGCPLPTTAELKARKMGFREYEAELRKMEPASREKWVNDWGMSETEKAKTWRLAVVPLAKELKLQDPKLSQNQAFAAARKALEQSR